MGLRSWTAAAIRDGNSIRWTVGLLVKFVFEGSAAMLFGWMTTKVVLWQFPVSALDTYLGASTFSAVWLVIAGGVFAQFTMCKFTQPLMSS